MNNTRNFLATCFASGLAVVAFVMPAQATAVLSDSLEIFFNGVLVPNDGTTAGWNVYKLEGDPEGGAGGFVFSEVPVDPNPPGRTVVFESKSDPTISDLVEITFDDVSQTLQLGFLSDTETGLIINPSLKDKHAVEDNGPIDVTSYLAPGLRDAGYTAKFTSDVEAVPAPATLPLFATGLGLMGLLGWRKKARGRHSAGKAMMQ